LFIAKRTSTPASFGSSTPVAGPFTTDNELRASITGDSSRLFFSRGGKGNYLRYSAELSASGAAPNIALIAFQKAALPTGTSLSLSRRPACFTMAQSTVAQAMVKSTE
jgi:hypothetical protein